MINVYVFITMFMCLLQLLGTCVSILFSLLGADLLE